MTVSTETNKVVYNGLTGQDTFAYTFRVDNKEDMDVFLDATIIPDGDWSITGLGNPSGGDVILNTPLVADASVTLLRDVDFTQLTDYQPNDPFPAETHELALDKLTFQTQQLNEQLERVPQLPVDTPLDGYDLGTPEANMVIQYNATEDGQESTGIDATTFNQRVQDAEQAATDAEAARDTANQWAEEAEDVEVKPGQFSAFHWAMKSQAFTDWEKYLDGYDPTTSRHERYMGTLDAILINSKYFIDSTEIIGGPADFVGLGIIETNMWDTDTNQAVQLLVSMDVANNGAAWIREREGGTWGAWSPFGAGGTTVTDTAPSSPSVGDGWWDPDTGKTYIWYDDGSSQQWVEQDPDTSLLAGAPLEVFINGELKTGVDAASITGLPEGIKNLSISLDAISLTNSDQLLIRFGTAGGIQASGYNGNFGYVQNAAASVVVPTTAGLGIHIAGASRGVSTVVNCRLLDEATNRWVLSYNGTRSDNPNFCNFGTTTVTLSAPLSQIELIGDSVGTVDGGAINVQYENPAAQANLPIQTAGTHVMGFYDGNSGGANQSPTTVVAQWYKVGRLVHLTVPNTGPISVAGMTGANRLYFDLPFIPSHTVVGSVMVALVNYGGLATSWVAYVGGGADRGYFKVSQEQVSEVDIQVQNFGGNGEIVSMTIVYTTDE